MAAPAEFVARAEAVGARVVPVAGDEVAAAIDGAAADLAGLGLTSEVRLHFPLTRVVERRGRGWPAAAVSLSPAGIAATGTVVIAEPDHRDRLLCQLCLRHIVLLRRTDLLPTPAAAMPWLRAHPEIRYVTFATGPSRTSDIERVLSVGVHGPREMVILLVG